MCLSFFLFWEKPLDHRQLICGRMCRYFKPEKFEDPGCGGVEWLKKQPQCAEALAGIDDRPAGLLHGLNSDDPRLWMVCDSCEFRVDGCDFRDPQVSRDECEPCGGLRAVAGLLAAGLDIGL